MYEIRPAGAKGLGVFAKALIPRGTRIFSERPLLRIAHSSDDGAGAGAVLHALGALTVAERASLLGLSAGAPRRDVALLRWGQVAWYRALGAFGALTTSSGTGRENRVDAVAGEVPSPEAVGRADDVFKVSKKDSHKVAGFRALNVREHVRVLAVFRSNAFDIGADRQALFPTIARINHSCKPCAESHFHEGLGRLNVHATRDICGGEEVMINYLKETGVVLREQRQARLQEGYGFDCDCAACDANSQRAREGEARRAGMLSDLARYAHRAAELAGLPSRQGMEAELAVMVAMVKLFEDEGLTGRALSS